MNIGISATGSSQPAAVSWLSMLAAIILMPLPSQAQQSAAPLPTAWTTSIQQVTVFPGGAVVERRGTAQLGEGRQRLTIAGLPAWLDPTYIQASLPAGAAADMLAAHVQIITLPYDRAAACAAAETRVRHAEARLARAVADKQAWLAQATHLASLSPQLHHDQPDSKAPRLLSALELKDLNDYLVTARLEVVGKLADLNAAIATIEPELVELRQAVADARTRPPVKAGLIHIDLYAAKAGAVEVAVRYLIAGASWYPRHTVEVDSQPGQLKVRTDAIIQQATGEDWQGVAVAVATAPPPSTPEPESEFAQWATAAPDATGNALQIQAAKDAVLANLDRAKLMQRQLAVAGTPAVMPGSQNISLAANGQMVAARLAGWEAPIDLMLSALPATSNEITASGSGVLPTAAAVLLPGPVHIRRDNRIVAHTSTQLVLAGQPFRFQLGTVDFLRMTRQLDLSASQLLRKDNSHVLELAYVLSVHSNAAQQFQIELAEPLASYRRNAATVALLDAEPRARHLGNGDLAWHLTVPSRGSAQLRYRVAISYPADAALPPDLAFLEPLLQPKP